MWLCSTEIGFVPQNSLTSDAANKFVFPFYSFRLPPEFLNSVDQIVVFEQNIWFQQIPFWYSLTQKDQEISKLKFAVENFSTKNVKKLTALSVFAFYKETQDSLFSEFRKWERIHGLLLRFPPFNRSSHFLSSNTILRKKITNKIRIKIKNYK